jgi:hypothetical protein
MTRPPRDKQTKRQAALRQLEHLMKTPGNLPSVPEPVPLHKMNKRNNNNDGRTTS